MKSQEDNPSENAIPPGVSESALLDAIAASGYPLQSVVASELIPEFNTVEEWTFDDPDGDGKRSLDITCFKFLADAVKVGWRPALQLLIECKQSRHPFVFFRRADHRHVDRFPDIFGISRGHTLIQDERSGRTAAIWPALVLNLDKHPFVTQGPPVCASFSRAVVEGKKVQLSGADPFKDIVLPLTKAFRFVMRYGMTRQPSDSTTPTMVLCIAVMDAPMLVVDTLDRQAETLLRPWVRVIRQESSAEADEPLRTHAIDFVHVSYLRNFLDAHLRPFASAFADRVTSAEDVLRYGGTLPDWRGWDHIELIPRPKAMR